VLRLVDVPSARAEASVYRANEVLAAFRSRWTGLVPGGPAAYEVARDALLRLITIAEMFAGEHLVDLAEHRLPDDDFVLRIWDERMPRVVRDWHARKTAWKNLFEIKWSYRYWNELEGFITARNIVAHGMGELTRSHLRRGQIKKSVTDQLAAAGLALRGHELVPTETDVERCGRRVKYFVTWLDGQSRNAAS
jgi:hypothetical protein